MINSIFNNIDIGIQLSNNILPSKTFSHSLDNNNIDFTFLINNDKFNISPEFFDGKFTDDSDSKDESLNNIYEFPNQKNKGENSLESITSPNNDSQKKLVNEVFNIFKFEEQSYKKGEGNKAILRKKKNEKKLKKAKKKHGGGDDDNLKRKIQVHFLNFIINYSNDVIRSFIDIGNKLFFSPLDYKLKKDVKNENVESLKKKSLGEIIQLKVSPKMKKNNNNTIIFKEICKLNPSIQTFFQMNYKDLFIDYYYNKNKCFEFNGKNIHISIKTKTFNDLLIKHCKYHKRLKYIAINYFLNHYKRTKKIRFKTCICTCK